jgi:SAM-dependent methyltransferase
MNGYTFSDAAVKAEERCGETMATKYEAIVSTNGTQGKRTYLITNGRRRELLDRSMELRFAGLPSAMLRADEICGYPLSAPILSEPALTPPDDRAIATPMDLKRLLTWELRGVGLEIGAGNVPFPLPLGCSVSYADRISANHFAVYYAGYRDAAETKLDAVHVDHVTDIENLDPIDDESLDFIIASHVIEHSRNPIKAIAQAFRKLRTRGHLVLVIPDMTRTFDSKRTLTPVRHLIADYVNPSRERDRQHYLEVATLSFPHDGIQIWQRIETWMHTDRDIHFHTFTYESFRELIDVVRKRLAPWSSVWSRDARDLPWKPAEFYFVLTK